MIEHMIRHYNILSIVGNIITVNVASATTHQDITTRFGDLARIEDPNGSQSLAQVIKIDGSKVSLQVFSGTRGISTAASVFFGPRPASDLLDQHLSRIFNGTGE